MARHGPRVLGVCQRVLRDEHAAEDAFQNVFLLLARKAGSIRERTMFAAWLAVVCLSGSGLEIAGYGTANQTLQTPPTVEVNREAAEPDLPPEPRKEERTMPIDPKHLAQLAEQLRSKNWDERSAALTVLDKLVPAKGAGKMDFGPVIEPLLDLSGWGGEASKNALQAEQLIVRMGGQTAPSLRRRLNSPEAHDRRVAAELLSRVEPPSPSLAELLRPLLADKDHYVRRAAIQGLGLQGSAAKAAIGDLENAVTAPNLPNRVTASVALINGARVTLGGVKGVGGWWP